MQGAQIRRDVAGAHSRVCTGHIRPPVNTPKHEQGGHPRGSRPQDVCVETTTDPPCAVDAGAEGDDPPVGHRRVRRTPAARAHGHPGGQGAMPAVGGAMDLAVGAQKTWVMMDLLTKQGQSKVVTACTYPLTAPACVKRIYSDLATLECTPHGLQLIDKVDGLTHAELEKLVVLPIRG